LDGKGIGSGMMSFLFIFFATGFAIFYNYNYLSFVYFYFSLFFRMFDTLYICPDFISLEILKTQESNAKKTPKVPSNGNSNALGPF
jgi:hypothetical protein